MIVYVAPQDTKLQGRTENFAKANSVRMVVADDNKLIGEDIIKAKKVRYFSNSYIFGEAETVWVVGHGNERVIGDKQGGVTLNASDIASIVKTLITNRSYRGSIMIDTCKSGVKSEDKSFADAVYENLKNDFENIHVGGWKGSVHGPIGGGQVELNGLTFKERGFAWAGGKAPRIEAHEILANLA
jgi:hypothetical protein